jgi:hypothetical protein
MPKPKPKPRKEHKHHRVPSSAIERFIQPERIDALLAPWIPSEADREFVVRCILAEGPAHHRGANYVLLALLGKLLERVGPPSSAPDVPSAPIAIRLPPHLTVDDEETDFPLRLPIAPLEQLADPDSPEITAMIDCLTDGPPQHALANAAMVCLLGEILRRVQEG